VPDDPARRTLLRRLALVGSVGVAGCSGEDTTQTTPAPTATPTDSPTPSPTAEQPSETETPDDPCPEPTDAPVPWRRETNGRNYEPIVRDGIVYFGTGGGGGRFRAVSLADGSELWRTRASGILYAPPTLGSSTVYYTDYSQVTAFAPTDGTEHWRHETAGDVPVPVAVDDDLVVFGESNHPTPQTTVEDQFDRVVALDSDGVVQWRTRYAPEKRAPVTTQPVVSGEAVIAASEDFEARAFDRSDGSLLWTGSVSEPGDIVAVNAGGTDAVAFASRGGVETLAVSDGRTLWRDRIGVEGVTVGGDRVFAASVDELRALDASDGTLLWSRGEFEGELVGLTADERRLLVSIRREATVEVAELARDTGCVIRSLEIQAGNILPPALGDGLAVVSTGADDESVYAVGTAGD
jgi:outer membrane protein assembly factor BamB